MKRLFTLFWLLRGASALADFAVPLTTPVPTKPVSPISRLMNQVKPAATIKPTLLGNLAISTPTAAAPPVPTTEAIAPKTSNPNAVGSAGVNPVPKGSGFASSGGGAGKGGGDSQAFSYNTGGGNRTGSGGGGGSGGEGTGSDGKPKAVAFKKWYPMCIFMDGATRNGNEVVKGLVDMAAKCEVNLVVFPFYVKNVPGNADALKNSARSECNAQDGFRQYGVNRASAIVLTGNHGLPGQMCHTSGDDANVCGEMGWQPDDGMEARIRSTNRWAGVAPAGKPAVGAVAASSSGYFNIRDVAAVTGQTFQNRPPGYGGGNGVGDKDEGQAAGGAGDGQGWSPSGCEAMREASFNNDGKWKYNAAQKDYVVKGDDPKRFLDLQNGKSIFKGMGGGQQNANRSDDKGGTGGGGGVGAGGIARGGGSGAVGGARTGGSAPNSSPFAFRKNAGTQGPAPSGRTVSGSDPLYSDATGGGDEPAPNVASVRPGAEKESETASAPGVIPMNGPGAAGGPGSPSQNIGYDESARRSTSDTVAGAIGSALTNAAAFFGGGTLTGAVDKKKASGLDADFFKKILSKDDSSPTTWRRKAGSSLRSDPDPSAATTAAGSESLPAREGLPKRSAETRVDGERAPSTREPAAVSVESGEVGNAEGAEKSGVRKASRQPASSDSTD